VFRPPLYAIADSGLPATVLVLTRGEMLEFEVMIRPIQSAGRGNGKRIGPQLAQIDGDRGRPALIMTVFDDLAGPFPRLRAPGPCGKDRRAL
jgi:hypothetical protein